GPTAIFEPREPRAGPPLNLYLNPTPLGLRGGGRKIRMKISEIMKRLVPVLLRGGYAHSARTPCGRIRARGGRLQSMQPSRHRGAAQRIASLCEAPAAAAGGNVLPSSRAVGQHFVLITRSPRLQPSRE